MTDFKAKLHERFKDRKLEHHSSKSDEDILTRLQNLAGIVFVYPVCLFLIYGIEMLSKTVVTLTFAGTIIFALTLGAVFLNNQYSIKHAKTDEEYVELLKKEYCIKLAHKIAVALLFIVVFTLYFTSPRLASN